MKILQVFNQYRLRGGEESWVEKIPDLVGDAAEVEELRFSSVDWIGNNAPSLFRQALLIGDNPASRAALRANAARFKPDVLLFHNIIPVGSFGLYQESKALGIPVMQYTHNFRPFSPSGTLWTGKSMCDAALQGNFWPEILGGAWQGSRIKTAILAWHLHRARRNGLLDCVDRWIAPCKFMLEKFSDAGIPREKISVLPHCWHAGDTEPDNQELGYYLFLGRIVAEKGVFDLIKSWKILENQLGDSCPELVIAGDGPEMNQMRELSVSLKKIRLVGFVDGEEKLSLIRHCRALVIPSICWETLGLTAYEAYAASRPVIATRSGALKETVLDGHTGWAHEAGNANDLARAVMNAENVGSAQRYQRGQQGREWLKHHASPEKWRNEFLRICRDVVARANVGF